MSEIKIHLRYNLETGKKDIIIKYESDDDALPYEHEQRHWEIVEQLIGEGVIDPEDVGNVRVGKLHDEDLSTPQQESTPQQQPQKAGE